MYPQAKVIPDTFRAKLIHNGKICNTVYYPIRIPKGGTLLSEYNSTLERVKQTYRKFTVILDILYI